MTYVRRLDRRSQQMRKKISRSSWKHQLRRSLMGEKLEERALLAGDAMNPHFVSDFWNPIRPADVNNDGLVAPIDALVVINKLNAEGAGELPQGSSGESDGSPRLYYDVNNDGFLSPIDPLIVINRLNSGEGEPTSVTYQIFALQPGTDTPVTGPLIVGQEYDVQIRVADVRPQVIGNEPRGVFSGYTDLLYTKALSQVRVAELQAISIQGNVNGGTFTLDFNGQVTAPITFTGNNDLLATRIQTALEGVMGAGNVQVVIHNTNIAAVGGRAFDVRFIGAFYDTDVPLLAVGSNNLTVSSGAPATITLTELIKGDRTIPETFKEAFRSYKIPNPDPNGLAPQTPGLYQSTLFAEDAPVDSTGAEGVNDLGALLPSVSPPGTGEFELVRARFIATSPGSQVLSLRFIVPGSSPPTGSVASPIRDTTAFSTLTERAMIPISEIDPGTPVTITILPAPLTARPDSATVDEDSAAGVVIAVLANDEKGPTAPPGAIELRSFTQPTGGAAVGTVTRDDNGTPNNQTDDRLRFVPGPNFSGTATFTYEIGIVGTTTPTATGTVTVTVNPINDPPVVTVPGPQTTLEEQPRVFSTANGNAITISDVDAGSADVQVTLAVTNGTLTMGSTTGLAVTGNGTANVQVTGPLSAINAGLNGLTFTPTPDFPAAASGQAVLTVTANDQGNTGAGGPQQGSGTVTITVQGVNDPPVNTLPAGPLAAVFVTDFLFTGANAVSVSDVDAGTGTIQVTLSSSNASAGTLVVTPGSATVTGNNSANLTITGTLSAVNSALASLLFRPVVGFVGSTTLTMTSNDQGNTGSGGPQQDQDQVVINVVPPVKPFALNDTFTFAEGSGPQTLNVLANDLVNDGASPLLVSFTQPPAGQGTVSRDDRGTPGDLSDDRLIYTPPGDPDFFTPDSVPPITFTYAMNETNGSGSDVTATVTIRITNVPDAPTTQPDNYQTSIGVPLTRTAAQGVLANDSIVDNNYGDPNIATMTAVLVSNASNGNVVLNADGSFTYTPQAGFFGNDTFTYRAVSSLGPQSAPTTVTIRVTSPPIATNDSYTATEDTVFNASVSVLANDTDPTENQPLSAVLVSNVPAEAGSVVLNSNGTFTYTPALNFNTTRPPRAPVTFTYKAVANGRESNVATVSITVNEVNDPPTANDDTFQAVKQQAGGVGVDQVVNVLANDTADPDGDEVLTVIAVGPTAQAANGSSVRLVNGQVLYTSPTVVGEDSFTYTISDGRGGQATATVRVTVIDFIPKDVSGKVYLDTNNNGVQDNGEKPLQGVEVRLNGTDFTGNLVALTAFTDVNGNFVFPGMRPGNYTVTQVQPRFLLDGIDSHASPLVTIPPASNDTFSLSWGPTDTSGPINSLRFGERGVDVSSLLDSRGLLAENFASSSGNGFVIATDLAGNAFWYFTLDGWTGALGLQTILSPDLASLTLRVTTSSGVQTVVLHQDPHLNGSNFAPGSQARFRILGIGPNNQYILRIDGTAAEMGLNLAATNGEGEGEAADGRQYADAVDAIFSGRQWS